MHAQIQNHQWSREFFIHAANAYHRRVGKKKELQKLNLLLKKAKILSLDSNASKSRVSDAYLKLENHILKLLAEDKEILLSGTEKKIGSEVLAVADQLDKKLDKYVQLINLRQEKIQKIEDKFKVSDFQMGLRENVINIELKKKLYDLEEKYLRLKRKEIPKDQLKIIEKKIYELKQKI